jgi:transcriptional regulator with XRE-family HTH domain
MSNACMRREQWDKQHEELRAELKSIRTNANLTQEELATRLDTKQSFISKYERGERTLDFIEVILVCNACGYAPAKLIRKLSIPNN